jgi:hypothetical protein
MIPVQVDLVIATVPVEKRDKAGTWQVGVEIITSGIFSVVIIV